MNHPDEVFNIGEKHDLKVISVDKEKLQVGCSVKQLSPDPFEHIENYELNKIYKVKVVKPPKRWAVTIIGNNNKLTVK